MDWYKLKEVGEPLRQGDFISDCPIIIPPSKIILEENIEVDVEIYDTVILSQSCDLAHGKIKLVLLAPIFTLENFCNVYEHFKNYKLKEALRKGDLPGYHLLDKCNFMIRPDLTDQYFVVNLKSVFSVNFDFLINHSENLQNRVSLNSPYVEHLSQAYARFMMRVGLPSTIPPFTK